MEPSLVTGHMIISLGAFSPLSPPFLSDARDPLVIQNEAEISNIFREDRE